jgi:S1-C subfamily serine protease
MEDGNGQPVSLGSGFFVSGQIVATNMHVIEGAARGYAKLIAQGPKYDIAGTVGLDTAADLALLEISGVQAPALQLGDSKQVAVGDQVYVVGNPEGLEGTFSQGIVSGIRTFDSDSILQITAPISPGSSGGPVLDSVGNVIGIAVATFKSGQNLNFAVPVSYLKSLLSKSGSAPTRALAAKKIDTSRSILSDLGGTSTEGVIGGKFLWHGDNAGDSAFSFTLENRLREPVKNIYALVIFHAVDGSPLDVQVIHANDMIPGGLGKRISSNVDISVRRMTTKTTGGGFFFELVPTTRVDFRILNFDIVQ